MSRNFQKDRTAMREEREREREKEWEKEWEGGRRSGREGERERENKEGRRKKRERDCRSIGIRRLERQGMKGHQIRLITSHTLVRSDFFSAPMATCCSPSTRKGLVASCG